MVQVYSPLPQIPVIIFIVKVKNVSVYSVWVFSPIKDEGRRQIKF